MLHFLLAALLAAAPANWPAWRNDGSGHYRGDDAPVQWDAENGVAWVWPARENLIQPL